MTKYAAVFPVFKNRDEEEASKEALALEEQLQSAAGYSMWLCEGRESIESPPRSTTLDDIQRFNTWFLERKAANDIHGVFIMLVYQFIKTFYNLNR